MWNRVAGIACRAAVAASLFFDRRMAASLAEALFLICGIVLRVSAVAHAVSTFFHCLRMYCVPESSPQRCAPKLLSRRCAPELSPRRCARDFRHDDACLHFATALYATAMPGRTSAMPCDVRLNFRHGDARPNLRNGDVRLNFCHDDARMNLRQTFATAKCA